MYTLTSCLGMFLGLCGQLTYFSYPSLQDCEKARDAVSAKAIGDGYAVCAPNKGGK